MPERPSRQAHDLVRSPPPCQQRDSVNQSTPAGLRPCQQMCIVCGRVTARRDVDDMPWCGGSRRCGEGAPDASPGPALTAA